jgi:hypothetical protein
VNDLAPPVGSTEQAPGGGDMLLPVELTSPTSTPPGLSAAPAHPVNDRQRRSS